MSRQILVPGPNHPITVEPSGQRVVVTVDGQPVADTSRALALQEADYPRVYYVPRADVDPAVLTASEHHTYCPFKGEASYHGLRRADGSVAEDVVWFYEQPYDAVDEIRDRLAFYADRVDVEVTPVG